MPSGQRYPSTAERDQPDDRGPGHDPFSLTSEQTRSIGGYRGRWLITLAGMPVKPRLDLPPDGAGCRSN